jgi:alpha/beta superfamily hydrolase
MFPANFLRINTMSYLAKLWRGEIGLAITYWLWGVLIVGLGIGIAGLVAAAAAGSGAVFLIWLVLYVVSLGFVVVAIWRSAGHYTGPRIWVWLARIVCVLAVFRLLGTPAEISGPIRQPSAEDASVRSLAEARAGFKTRLLREGKGRAPAPEPPPELFRMVRFPAGPGDLIAYVSTGSHDGKKHPAIIWIFGGFNNGIGDTAWQPASPENDQSARAFRQAGIITMYPSLRGGNHNPGFREGLYGEVDDIIAAANFLSREDSVDPNRIYLGGHSTGGTLALLVAEATNRFRAVFSFGPVADIRSYPAQALPFDIGDAEEVKLRSPIVWLSAINIPTFILEGEKQPNNITAFNALIDATHNRHITFIRDSGSNHFSILAKMTPLIADKLVKDTHSTVNIEIKEAEYRQGG